VATQSIISDNCFLEKLLTLNRPSRTKRSSNKNKDVLTASSDSCLPNQALKQKLLRSIEFEINESKDQLKYLQTNNALLPRGERYLQNITLCKETERTRQEEAVRQVEIKRAVRLQNSTKIGKVSLIIGRISE